MHYARISTALTYIRLPSSYTHPDSDLSPFVTLGARHYQRAIVDAARAGRPHGAHSHVIAGTTCLQAAPDALAPTSGLNSRIRYYYPRSSGLDRSAETRLSAVVDRVVAALEANVKVVGVWEIGRSARAVWGKDERETPVRFAEITLTAESRVLRA